MIIYPAIDIKDSQCVRLTQGRFDNVTVYDNDPVHIAKKWEMAGAQFLHIVDLDGARGEKNNRSLIKEIVKAVKIPIQTGGGIRTHDDMEELLRSGIKRIILGTSAVKSPEFVEEAVREYGEAVAVGIDAKDGFVAVSGWEELSNMGAIPFAKNMERLGVKTVIYTDIATDGMLSGPNTAAMRDMASSVGIEVIASGGIGSKYDILSLIPTHVAGVIVGKALYAGRVDLGEVLKSC